MITGLSLIRKQDLGFHHRLGFGIIVCVILRELEGGFSLFHPIAKRARHASSHRFQFGIDILAILIIAKCPQLTACLGVACFDTIGVSSLLVILFLGPGIVRMVVTLSTNHLRAEKHLEGVGHVVELHAGIPKVKPCRTVLPQVTFSVDQVCHKLVIGHVLFEGSLDPADVGSAGKIAHSGLDTKQVCPIIELVTDMASGLKELVDGLFPPALDRLLLKSSDFFNGWYSSNQIEIDTPQKNRCRRLRGGLKPFFNELFLDECVNLLGSILKRGSPMIGTTACMKR